MMSKPLAGCRHFVIKIVRCVSILKENKNKEELIWIKKLKSGDLDTINFYSKQIISLQCFTKHI